MSSALRALASIPVPFIAAVHGVAVMRAAKLVIDMVGRALTAADTDLLTRPTAEVYEGQDLREGVVAFIQRREPSFNMWEAH